MFFDRREGRIVLEGFRRSPTCNVRAKRHSEPKPTHFAHFLFAGKLPSAAFLHPLQARSTLTTNSSTTNTMFKRSFHSKDRAGKSVRPSKKSYREHAKVKLSQKMDSPPVGRSVVKLLQTEA